MRTFQFCTVFTVSLFRVFNLDEAIRPFFVVNIRVGSSHCVRIGLNYMFGIYCLIV